MEAGRLTLWLNGGCWLVELILLLIAVDGGRRFSGFVLGCALWLLAPFALLELAARFGRFPVLVNGSLMLTVMAGLWGSLMLGEMAFRVTTKPEAQDAALMVIVPGVQLMAIIPTIALLFGIGKVLTRLK
ncbi:MAG: hypothetical protein EBR95_04900 [Verrucomicrobia bacterium]|nr:hypothetical protein [Verrucomicrobiota bacterium]